jgi:hypothetical protein
VYLWLKLIRLSAPYEIQFIHKDSTNPASHPTRTICRPDIIVIRKYPPPKQPIDLNRVSWFHLEATGEEDSGKSKKDSEAQTGAYTTYHLQARPDLVSVVGIFVSVVGFKLFLSNACRVYHTPDINWSTAIGRQLLYAWMWRLYNPELDPSITIDMTPPTPIFTVTANGRKPYGSLSVFRTGESIGRRTIILARALPDFEPPRQLRSASSVGSKDAIIVIKEQYIEEGRRFKEGPILEKIHTGGRFPGVVRLDHYEHVEGISVEHQTNSDDKVKRLKTRLVLKDRGTRLADVKTPREFLMGIYDLLESEWPLPPLWLPN